MQLTDKTGFAVAKCIMPVINDETLDKYKKELLQRLAQTNKEKEKKPLIKQRLSANVYIFGDSIALSYFTQKNAGNSLIQQPKSH